MDNLSNAELLDLMGRVGTCIPSRAYVRRHGLDLRGTIALLCEPDEQRLHYLNYMYDRLWYDPPIPVGDNFPDQSTWYDTKKRIFDNMSEDYAAIMKAYYEDGKIETEQAYKAALKESELRHHNQWRDHVLSFITDKE